MMPLVPLAAVAAGAIATTYLNASVAMSIALYAIDRKRNVL